MARFIRYSLASADSNGCNSLEGIENYVDQDTALVQEANHWFRFFAASTLTPDGVLVLAPADITPPDPGRWIRQGPPALVGNRSQHPVIQTDPCSNGSQGPQGAQGAAGAQGAQGAAGAQGAQGASGVACPSAQGVVVGGGTSMTFAIDITTILAALSDPDSQVGLRLTAALQSDSEGSKNRGTAIVPLTLLTVAGAANSVVVANGLTGGGTTTLSFVHSMGSTQDSAGSETNPVWSAAVTGAAEITVTATGLETLEAGSAELCLGPQFATP